MAVSVPAWKLALTRSTATWPPKRMERSRVSNTGVAIVASRHCRREAEAVAATPPRGSGLRPASPDAAQPSPALAFRAHGKRHLLGRDGVHQLQDVVVLGVLLDAEVIHVLQGLMVLLAEGHGSLGRGEGEALHGGD